MAKVLMIEDDEALGLMISTKLTADNYEVTLVNDGLEGVSLLERADFDLLILDWNLPGLPGVEICRRFRERGGTAPVLMLTGRNSPMDKVQGLDFGADDYLTKPFDANELMARVRALMRRVGFSPIDTKLVVGNLIVHPGPIRVTVSDVELSLRKKEFQVLELLARRAETVISANYILERVWGYSDDEAQGNLRTYIKTLRKALEGAGSSAAIQTVHGVGYKLSYKPN